MEHIDGAWLVSRPSETLSVPPLTLRRATREDATDASNAVVVSWNELRDYMPWAEEAKDEAELRSGVDSYYQEVPAAWENGWAFQYLIFHDGVKGTVGAVAGHNRVKPGVLEIGYWMRSDMAGRGIMTASVKLLTDALFALPEVETIRVENDLSNAASAAITKKLGFEYVGDEPRDQPARKTTGANRVWTMTREQWASL